MKRKTDGMADNVTAHITPVGGNVFADLGFSPAEANALQAQVLAQAHAQLGLQLQPVQTVVEKRATFACTPALVRPPQTIAPGLFACGDYVEGPYPATLEGAVRSAAEAVSFLAPSPLGRGRG